MEILLNWIASKLTLQAMTFKMMSYPIISVHGDRIFFSFEKKIFEECMMLLVCFLGLGAVTIIWRRLWRRQKSIFNQEPLPPSQQLTHLIDEMKMKLDLAKHYQNVGDIPSAISLLENIIRFGDDENKKEAEAFLLQLR